jgi:hypothetical protein
MAKIIKKIISRIGFLNVFLYLYVIAVNLLTFDSSIMSFYFFSKLAFILLPVYLLILFNKRRMLVDKYFVILPVFFWFILAAFFGFKSGVNCMVVEPFVVMILSGLYLPVFWFNNDVIRKKMAIVLVLVSLMMVFIGYNFIPVFGG